MLAGPAYIPCIYIFIRPRRSTSKGDTHMNGKLVLDIDGKLNFFSMRAPVQAG